MFYGLPYEWIEILRDRDGVRDTRMDQGVRIMASCPVAVLNNALLCCAVLSYPNPMLSCPVQAGFWSCSLLVRSSPVHSRLHFVQRRRGHGRRHREEHWLRKRTRKTQCQRCRSLERRFCLSFYFSIEAFYFFSSPSSLFKDSSFKAWVFV